MLNRICIALLTSVISASVCSENIPNWQETCRHHFCEAIIDAGSSGSRLYVYAKEDAKWQVVYNQQLYPGLSNIAVDNVGTYLEKLVQIHPEQAMPILLYGTAGMRLLSADEQYSRYQAAISWFNQHPEWILKDARTITGQEEGVFAWFAVQEEMGLLDKPVQHLNSVIEIGGASAQVSVPVSEEEARLLPADEVYPVQWNQQTIHVWSKSYLGLGINEVEKNFANASSCYSSGYPLKDGSYGQGDMTVCVQQMEDRPALDLLAKLSQAKSVAHDHPASHWVALGAIRFTALRPPFRFLAQEFSLKQLKQQGDDELCHQDWQSLSHQFSSDPYLYRGCLAASYFYSSLSDGIGIQENDKIFYPDANAQMDWTLGALLLG